MAFYQAGFNQGQGADAGPSAGPSTSKQPASDEPEYEEDDDNAKQEADQPLVIPEVSTNFYGLLPDCQDGTAFQGITNFTINQIAFRMNESKELVEKHFVVRDACDNTPLGLINVTSSGFYTFTNVTGAHLLTSAQNCLDMQGFTDVICNSSGLGRIGPKAITDMLGTELYMITYNFSQVKEYYVTSNQLVAKISTVPSHRRLLLQMSQNSGWQIKALCLVLALRVYHRMEQFFSVPYVFESDSSYESLFKMICRKEKHDPVVIPSFTKSVDSPENCDAMVLDNLSTIYIERVRLKTSRGVRYYYITSGNSGKILFTVEKDLTSPISQLMVRHLSPCYILFYFDQLNTKYDSQVFFNKQTIGMVRKMDDILYMSDYEELLQPCYEDGASVGFQRQPQTRYPDTVKTAADQASAIVTLENEGEKISVKFDGFWDVKWKCLMMAFALKWTYRIRDIQFANEDPEHSLDHVTRMAKEQNDGL